MQKIIDKFRENFKWQAITIIGLTAIAYGFLINNMNLWLDEIYSVLMAKDSLKDIFATLFVEDTNLPLYYIYLKAVLSLSPKAYEVAAAHFGSALLLIIAQIFAATAVRRDYGEKTALWLMILIALLPQSLWLGLEVRTYMLSSLLLLMAAVLGARMMNKPLKADYIKFGLVSILALYSHYYCALFLMFLYGIIFISLLRENKKRQYLYHFILTAVLVALLFAPWLFVFSNAVNSVGHIWYVHDGFVRFSWQFFTNPLQPEIIQSVYFIATTFSASVFSFLLVLGLTNIYKFEANSRKMLILTVGCFCLTYILLLFLSVVVRPMVTARYLKIFSMPLYLGGAIVIAKYKEIAKAVLTIFLIGFYFTYTDIRIISFDKGYQNAIHDIKQFIAKDKPLLVTDNSNLFCEYFLPEYNCLLLAGNGGEILRKKSQLKAYQQMHQLPQETVFSISIYGMADQADQCSEYKSDYRFGQSIKLCRFDEPEVVENLLNKSYEIIRKRVHVLDY